ncbi:MaoC/PaaZ C-terminal domain-containing protein [Herbaspirillum sp. RV1423]|uniref:MaoC/PaaZ C-terminal domain-containing protein n=1 Tax=Herbaspirillum sp. RV1423 TaxID=1443993 RepID=UPI0004B9D2DC|nr:MaoC/PaaZ C-terminal domain-containing protein [Herbaspirillum sp. RV1423]
MAIDYHKLKNWNFPVLEHSYTEKDSMLYALGVGVGAEPTCAGQLQFVYEPELKTLPCMAVIMAHPGLWMGHPETGVDLLKVVHGEQKLQLHRPLPVAGCVTGHSRVIAVVDKGRDKGALLVVQREIRDKQSGELLATAEQTSFCRGDGGFSEHGQLSDAAPASDNSPLPDRSPDLICDLPTRPEGALIYRLSADRNPLHADPETARQAGFPAPILHGLATYGVACHALLRACCDYRPERLRSLATRFSAPVFPGETIRTEIWRDGGHVRFQSRVLERAKLVLSNGSAQVSD